MQRKFAWKGLGPGAKNMTGEIDAMSELDARAKLERLRVKVESIRAIGEGADSSFVSPALRADDARSSWRARIAKRILTWAESRIKKHR